MSLKKVSVAIILALALTGCSSNRHQQFINTTVIDNPNNADRADIKLSEAADSVSQSLQDLAATERAAHPGARLPTPPSPAAIGMAGLASVDWTGPAEPLVRKIAKVTDYHVRVLGRAPAIPVIVSISAQSTPLADILRDISFQIQNKATLVLYPGSRVIEFRYIG